MPPSKQPRRPDDPEVDLVVSDFQSQWSSGSSPKIEEFLKRCDAPRQEAAFPRLLLAEVRSRLKRKQRPRLSEYVERFPDRAPQIRNVFKRLEAAAGGKKQDASSAVQNRRSGEEATQSFPQPSGDTAKATGGAGGPAETPSSIDRFQVLRVLGEGGFGAVHLARDPKLRRDVAIKAPRAGALARSLLLDTTELYAVGWRPDGQALAAGSKTWSLHFVPLNGAAPAQYRERSGPVLDVSWGPQGRWVATGSEGGIVRLWDPSNGRGRVLWDTEARRNMVGSHWNDAAKTLLTMADDGELRGWSAEGQPMWRVDTGLSKLRCLRCSPDGRFLAVGGWDRDVGVLASQSGQEVRRFPSSQGGVALAWSPDSRYLAVGGSRGLVELHDLADNTSRSFQSHAEGVASLAWSPDGKTLVTGSSDCTMAGWDPVSGQPRWAAAPLSEGNAVTLQMNGSLLAGTRALAQRSLVGIVEQPDGRLELEDYARLLVRVSENSP